MDVKELHPLIFDIRHFALDDGPGIRTTLFLKGCPLSCSWCHNPESMKPYREIAFYPQKCIRCGDCVKVCPAAALDSIDPGNIDRNKCTACGICTEACPSTALRSMGKHYPAAELADILLRDRMYYETSKGGVTFSGGEPTLHIDYLHQIMIKLKQENIHIAIQTCGIFNLPAFKEKLLPFIDLIFYDIKIIDSIKHKKHTGSGNGQIITNFKNLLEESRTHGKFEIITRTPVIPGINDSAGDMAALLRFYKSLDYTNFMMLPCNYGGIFKRELIGG